MHHGDLSDEELESQLGSLCLEGRRLVARLITHLIEVEDRALDKKAAYSSMWEFCIKRLRMSEGETSRRLNAMKLVRRFPSLLGRIERGEIHLSALKIVGPYLDASNADVLLDGAAGKTKGELKEMLARRFPRPDVPTIEVALPPAPSARQVVPAAGVAPSPAARVEPLSATRYMVQVTLSKAAYDDLKRAKDLMGHRIPNGETAAVVESALRLLVEKLERERLGKTSRPIAKTRPSKPGHIPAATRRAVFERDGERCTYVNGVGRRCESAARLELDHIEPRALGGGDDAGNLRVRCRAHNRLWAEEVFGKERVAESIHCRQRKAQRVIEAPRHDAQGDAPRDDAMPAETIARATRGLVNMGFAKADVQKTLGVIARGDRGGARSEGLPGLVRMAIAALT